MVERVFLYLVFHHIIWMICFWGYARWVDRNRGLSGAAIVGIGLAYACLATELLPFLLPSQQDAIPLENRHLQYLCGLGLVGVLASQVLFGVVRLGGKLNSQKALGHCESEKDPYTPKAVRARFRLAREKVADLQGAISRDSPFSTLLILSESVDRPLLWGLSPPRIYLPLALTEWDGELQVVLVSMVQLGRTRRYRAYVFLWWLAQVNLVLLPLVAAIRRAVEWEWNTGLQRMQHGDAWTGAPFAAHAAGRSSGIADMGIGPSYEADQLSLGRNVTFNTLPLVLGPVTMTILGFAFAAKWAGGLRILEFVRFIMKQEIVGYSVHGFDPSVEFKAIPGEGGILPDGLLVDTTKADSQAGCATVRIPLGLFDHEKLIPFGAKAVRVRLAWRVLARAPAAKELPAVKLAASEQGVIDPDGQQKLWTFYTRNVFLGEDGRMEGVLDLPMLVHTDTRVLEQSKDVIYGPLVFIPEGWKLEFRHYAVEQIETSQVPPIPEGEPERFIAWYHRNGFKPATIDLTWRSPGAGKD